MKYDIDVDPSDSNTSHGVVLELVGTGKRVLDVGCSTGYLARLLKGRGNTVLGVEIDPEAAATAERWVDRVVVGDLEKLDLAEEFDDGEFDVIVFADVLEHISDPARTLRQSVSLLRAGGSVVVSIPNVAHGAVRLALLEGRFEYSPLGLLDDTHVRFFTRSTLENLLLSSGFTAVEWRRTTAPVFATEIQLNPAHFSPAVVDAVEADADAATYQFVLRAMPTPVDESSAVLAAELVAKDQQLDAMRRNLESILAAAEGPAGTPAVGIVGGGTGLLDEVRSAVVTAELRRRLHGVELRFYSATSSEAASSWDGETAEPMLPWSASRAARIAGAVDAVVLADGATPDAIALELARENCEVFAAGTLPPAESGTGTRLRSDGDDPDVPDLLCLAGRVHDRASLARRVEYLRVLGRVPEKDGYVLAAFGDPADPNDAALPRALDELARRAALPVLFLTSSVSRKRPAFPCPLEEAHDFVEIDDPFDLLAIVSGAEVVVTDSPSLLVLAAALGRPYQGLVAANADEMKRSCRWLGDTDSGVDRPALLPFAAELAGARARNGAGLLRAAEVVDLAFDELCVQLRNSVGRRAQLSIPSRLTELSARVRLLEQAHRSLHRRMAFERAAFGERARELQSPPVVVTPPRQSIPQVSTEEVDALRDEARRVAKELAVARNERDAERRRVQAAETERDAARAELAALYSTKTMRWLRPIRGAYRRLR